MTHPLSACLSPSPGRGPLDKAPNKWRTIQLQDVPESQGRRLEPSIMRRIMIYYQVFRFTYHITSCVFQNQELLRLRLKLLSKKKTPDKKG